MIIYKNKALSNVHPFLSKVDYLPGMIFPFIKLFSDHELECFEVIKKYIK